MAIVVKRSVMSGESDIVAQMLDLIYPVGSYYETSDTSFDPNVSWGGTWLEDTDGRMLVALDTGTFNTVGGTGGAETHTHGLSDGWAQVILKSDSRILYREKSLTNAKYWTANYGLATGSPETGSQPNQSYGAYLDGNSNSSSSLPPYVVVKRWHRTA